MPSDNLLLQVVPALAETAPEPSEIVADAADEREILESAHWPSKLFMRNAESRVDLLAQIHEVLNVRALDRELENDAAIVIDRLDDQRPSLPERERTEVVRSRLSGGAREASCEDLIAHTEDVAAVFQIDTVEQGRQVNRATGRAVGCRNAKHFHRTYPFTLSWVRQDQVIGTPSLT